MATVHQKRTLLYRRTVKAQGEESRHGRDAVSKVKRVDMPDIPRQKWVKGCNAASPMNHRDLW